VPSLSPFTWGIALAVAGALLLLGRIFARRSARRAVFRFRSRIDRFKLTRKRYIIDRLLAAPVVAQAVRDHVRDVGGTEAQAWRRVRGYLDEIVPFFSILAYYRFGYSVSRVLLNLFYKVSVDYERPDPFRHLPRDAIVIYLMNHRSNADYVLVAYALAGDVSLSYAVGEWARAFPLEYAFKSFGSYFIRRKYREVLYHAVLRAYVELITSEGVTQGIFPEGGLTRDGRLRPAKIGLLDYALGVARDPSARDRMYVIPVGINYDRVLEDRSLLRELESPNGTRRPSRLVQLWEILRYVGFGAGRLLTRRWKRYGRAAVTIGSPMRVSQWLDEVGATQGDLFALPRTERLGHVQRFCDSAMARIGDLVPVTPVPLVCAALQTFSAGYVRRDQLIERVRDIRDALRAVSEVGLRDERDAEALFERAYRMLRMRRVLARQGEGYFILERGRPLVSYYANSIAHLIGPYAEAVRERDTLPALAATGWTAPQGRA
jgi:glycerol-3-phosphate O-acyltransferase